MYDSNNANLGWFIVYIEGFQVMISQKDIVFLSLKIDFVFKLTNSADPDEMLHNKFNAAFHLGFLCLPKYLFRGNKIQVLPLKGFS